MTTRRPGFALVLSMALVLALAILGAGILAVGTREAAVAGTVSRRAQAVRTAEAAVLGAVDGWSTRSVAGLIPGEHRTLHEDASSRTTATRIDTALFLVRGEGRVPGPQGPATARAAVLVRTLPPGQLARAFPGALTSTGSVVVAGGSVQGTETGAGTTTGPSCEPPTPGVVASAVTVSPAASVTGRPGIDSISAPRPLVLDPFGPLAYHLAGIRYSGPTVTPRAAAAGGMCTIDPLNWGSPDPGHPCHDLLPMVISSDLTLLGGYARGVLVVDGDLRMMGGARLEGVVVVQGRLTLDDGSVIHGAARADSAVVLDGSVIRDGCAVRAALSSPALDRGFRPPNRWWIPAF